VLLGAGGVLCLQGSPTWSFLRRRWWRCPSTGRPQRIWGLNVSWDWRTLAYSPRAKRKGEVAGGGPRLCYLGALGGPIFGSGAGVGAVGCPLLNSSHGEGAACVYYVLGRLLRAVLQRWFKPEAVGVEKHVFNLVLATPTAE